MTYLRLTKQEYIFFYLYISHSNYIGKRKIYCCLVRSKYIIFYSSIKEILKRNECLKLKMSKHRGFQCPLAYASPFSELTFNLPRDLPDSSS